MNSLKSLLRLLIVIMIFAPLKSWSQNEVISDSANYFYENFQFQKALDYLTRKDSIEIKQLLLLSNCYLKLGEDEEAKNIMLRAYQKDSSNLRVIHKLASIHKNDDKYNKAIYLYSRLIKSDPNNPYYYRELGQIHLLNKDLINAIKTYKVALELNPNDTKSRIKLAETYIKIKQYELAEQLVNEKLSEKTTNKALLNLSLKVNYSLKKY